MIGGSLLSLSFEKQYLGQCVISAAINGQRNLTLLVGGNLVYYVLSAIALLGFFTARFIPSIPIEMTKDYVNIRDSTQQ